MRGLAFLFAAAASAAMLDGGARRLIELIERSKSDGEALARELAASELSILMPNMSVAIGGPPSPVEKLSAGTGMPVVLAHGMGDSCFNPGFRSVTKLVGAHLGVYSTCIPTGGNWIEDTINGFLMNMDRSVDVFAEAVRADPKLSAGFSAIGLSQGNNLVRGYIQKYNDPPVHAFLSICGINAGVAGFPRCPPSAPLIGGICTAITELLGDFAYIPFVQEHLFQANCECYRNDAHA